MKALAQYAVEAARSRGADYADARVVLTRDQHVKLQDLSPKSINDITDEGIGVRVLKNGAWGFSSTSRLDRRTALKVTHEAVAVAEASSLAKGKKGVILTLEPVNVDRFEAPVDKDPFKVPIEAKQDLLYRASRKMQSVKGIAKTAAFCHVHRLHQFFSSTEGSDIEIVITRVNAELAATAVGNDDSKTRSTHENSRNAGWEYIESLDLDGNAERFAEEAVAKLYADYPEDGRMDLLLDPKHLSLVIHESVGHATELDRVLGYEANFAGTSFMTLKKRTHGFRYGSDIVNFVADNTLPGGLATTGYDDEGVACQRWDVVRNGMFTNYSTSREVALLAGYARSFGSGRAQGYSFMPINRIPNLCLEPGTHDVSPEELASDIKRGVWIEGYGLFSIDQRRMGFQFGGDLFFEIRNGKKGKMLRDVTYQSITPRFWNAVDGLSGKRWWRPIGVLDCGKGAPEQTAQMTHGAPWIRVRGIKVSRGVPEIE
ncbi:TldD/PmbA family protein [candidate division WOR-3 bacterium]|nr:TldD/PmbA family protein [candidate division WOR-3 bacterium]